MAGDRHRARQGDVRARQHRVVRDQYLGGRPTLEGRVLFASGEPPEPWAGFVKRNDPLADRARIEELVAAGYTRAHLARELGSQAASPTLQIGRRLVRASTARAVEELHRRLIGSPGPGRARPRS